MIKVIIAENILRGKESEESNSFRSEMKEILKKIELFSVTNIMQQILLTKVIDNLITLQISKCL